MKTRVEFVVDRMNWVLQYEAAAVAKFTAELAKTPMYALEWADGVTRTCAEAAVARYVLGYITGKQEAHPEMEGDDIVRDVAVQLQKQLNSKATSQNNSSSPSANMVNGHRLQALAKMLDYVQFC